MSSAVHLDPARVRPLRRAEYERLVELGMFADERVELIYGVLVRMSPQGSRHSAVLQRLTRHFVVAVGERGGVRVQSPLAAANDSLPEPDLAVVPPGDYDRTHPRNALLVIEVADSSLAHDRAVKAALYAGMGVPEYWIVNLVDDLVEVHSDIVRGAYSRVAPYRRGERIVPAVLAGAAVDVAEVLGSASGG